MEVPSKTSKPHLSGNDESESKRQKSASSTITRMAGDDIEGVLVAIHKLTKLVEEHPHLYSKLEEMLKDVYNTLEPEVPAATRTEKNEVSCPIYKLSNDELKLIFGYAGEMQYCFVARASDRFKKSIETFGNETLTSFRNVTVSMSRAKLCLDNERLSWNNKIKLFNTAARDGKLDILKWGDDSGYDLKHRLDEDTIAAALNGHLEVVQ